MDFFDRRNTVPYQVVQNLIHKRTGGDTSVPSMESDEKYNRLALVMRAAGYHNTHNKSASTVYYSKGAMDSFRFSGEDLNDEQGRFSHLFGSYTPEEFRQKIRESMKGTGQKFRSDTVLNQSFQSTQSLAEGFKHGISNGKYFAAFDLETDGGKMMNGREYGRVITEFGYATYQELPGQKAVKKKGGTILGFSAKQRDDALALIDKMEQIGYENLERHEQVSIQRYALHGHEKTTIDFMSGDKSKNAWYQFTGFASKEDIIGHPTASMAREGVEKLREVGIRQEKAGTVEYMGRQVPKHIAPILDFFRTPENGISPAYVTTNGLDFDY